MSVQLGLTAECCKLTAFLVLGPESSGTRLVTRLLVAAGCAGTDAHHQWWDREAPTAERIVWRRSVPHGGRWPDVERMVWDLREAGYAVRAVVTTRDWFPAAMSQNGQHVRSLEQAYANLKRALPIILAHLQEAGVDYELVSYEGLVARPRQMVAWLTGRLGLPMPGQIEEIVDGNEKWWGKQQPAVSDQLPARN